MSGASTGPRKEEGHALIAPVDPIAPATTNHDDVDAKELTGHAYHQNLPSNYIDDDGVSKVTKYAHQRARAIIRLVHSIKLREELYSQSSGDNGDGNGEYIAMDVDVNDDNFDDLENDLVEEGLDGHISQSHNDTLERIVKKCERLSSMMSSLETLKYGGISQKEMCFMILHVLRLCSATIKTEPIYKESNGDHSQEMKERYILKFDHVGQLYEIENGEAKPIFDGVTIKESDLIDQNPHKVHRNDLSESFALPSPARESLLSLIIMILTKDKYLRAVSNQSFTVPNDEIFGETSKEKNDSLLLVINWKALLRMLLRTAPYLDEKETGKPHTDSLSRQSTILKRTTSIIRYSRRFFDQGLDVKNNNVTDKTAKEVWEMVKADLISQSHSNACFRASILLYLFHPTRCTSEFYVKVIPTWLDCWSSIDRCPEFDFLWINMFCRSRRYIQPDKYDWGPLRRRLLTLCGYWLQIPVGGRSSDKAFPRAAEAKSRGIPSRLKTFVRSDSSYQEGVDFVAKLSKLLVFCSGKNDMTTGQGQSLETTSDETPPVSHGTEDLLRFFSFVGPYFNPSNTGSWTFPLGVMLHYISFELCRRIGRDDSQETLLKSMPNIASTVANVEPFKKCPRIPDHEIVLILDAILPLCQQALYSKSSHVSRAGEAALLYLSQIDYKVCSPLLDFAMRALDVSSVTQSHQAPAALSTLNRLVLPSLRKNPAILLERLPEILRLSLAGIDSNDEEKTIRTLVFYRTLTSWIPVGHAERMAEAIFLQRTRKEEMWRFGSGDLVDFASYDTDNEDFLNALKRLPSNSVIFQSDYANLIDPGDEKSRSRTLNFAEEASNAMADWSLSFLERIYGLFRAAGEQEKIGKSHRVATKRLSAADVSRARHFTRILKESLKQFFAAMDNDTFTCAMNSVRAFLIDETHPLAVKYGSALCEAIASARDMMQTNENCSPGLRNLVLPLTGHLENLSRKGILYRLRCFAGAVRRAGVEVLTFREQILSSLHFALKHDDKHIFKAGCKVLRHVLHSQSESYPVLNDSCSRAGSTASFGESAQLNDDKIHWHTPTASQLDFVAELISTFVYTHFRKLCSNGDFVLVERYSEMDINGEPRFSSSKHDRLGEWRRSLRILRYVIRGCPSMLLDLDESCVSGSQKYELDANECAVKYLIEQCASETKSILYSSRDRFAQIILHLLAIIASESAEFEPTIQMNKSGDSIDLSSMIASDRKICKEVAAISQLLFTRRSASFRSQDAFNLWKAQKDLSNDRVVLNHRKEVASVLQKAGCTTPDLLQIYSDGEEGGKSLPRRMLSNRVEIFLHSFQRTSSFQVPRRLRREKGLNSKALSDNISFLDINSFFDAIAAIVNTKKSIFSGTFAAVDKYEHILNGMCSLACHHNSAVRGYGISGVEYGFSRYGWLAADRTSHLINTLKVQDTETKYGIPSCVDLTLDSTSASRKRLAEILKGVCLIMAVPRVMKDIMSSEERRIDLLEALCGTQDVIAMLPDEEMQKMLSYLHQIFTSFRSRFFTMPRITATAQNLQESCLSNLLNLLKEKNIEESEINSSLNWRNRLIVFWFITIQVDKRYFLSRKHEIVSRVWETCISIIKSEPGQPMQKVALGLFGRLANIALYTNSSNNILCTNMENEEFCRTLSEALVYNHKEDKSVGGGHSAQWSIGVAEIIKDSSSNLAPKTIFPFLRAGRANSYFKVAHSQLIQNILCNIATEPRKKACKHLLSIAKSLASSLPSEDQRNQLCTSAEIFAGVFVGIMHEEELETMISLCEDSIFPFMDIVIEMIPSSTLGAFLDALRYGMSRLQSRVYVPLCFWAISKIENSLWQAEDDNATTAMEGFAVQSKWLAIMNIILIEMDIQTDSIQYVPWQSHLVSNEIYNDDNGKRVMSSSGVLASSWEKICSSLLPMMLNALGHPYQSCRERIASVLFRIAYCDRNRVDANDAAGSNTRSLVISKLLSLNKSTDKSSKIHQHSLITARLFISYCIHHGESREEFANYIISLLPLAFASIKPAIDEDESKEDDPEIRMLQGQVVKAYRYSISEISVSCMIAYGSSSDLSVVLETLDSVSKHKVWQLRLAVAHYLRCYQGNHKFLFSTKQTKKTTRIVARLLADERREVSAAAMAALTGILAATPMSIVSVLVEKYRKKANNSVIKKSKKVKTMQHSPEVEMKGDVNALAEKEKERAKKQQTSVYFLCAAVLATPYETPAYVPIALTALSKHSYEKSAPLAVRETVKMCCGEYKRTHMSDNWEIHRNQFTREQLEALEDVVSTPHYYA